MGRGRRLEGDQQGGPQRWPKATFYSCEFHLGKALAAAAIHAGIWPADPAHARCSSGLSGRRPSGPFVGLTAEAPAGVAETLREATLQSWHGIVQLALGERVDFVVVAGDVFEHANRTLRGQIRFRDGLADLARARIPSFVVTGNHDPLSGWEPSVVCCLRVGLLKTITSALGLRSSSLPSSALARAHSRSLANYPRSPRFRRTAAATRRRRGPDRTDDRA